MDEETIRKIEKQAQVLSQAKHEARLAIFQRIAALAAKSDDLAAVVNAHKIICEMEIADEAMGKAAG